MLTIFVLVSLFLKTLSVQYQCSSGLSSIVATNSPNVLSVNCGTKQFRLDSAQFYNPNNNNVNTRNDITKVVDGRCKKNSTINGCWYIPASNQLCQNSPCSDSSILQLEFHCQPTYTIHTVYLTDGVFSSHLQLKCPKTKQIVIDYAYSYTSDYYDCGGVITDNVRANCARSTDKSNCGTGWPVTLDVCVNHIKNHRINYHCV